MSLTRTLFNEFRPVLQMLDDPFFADPFSVVPQRHNYQTSNSNAQVSPWNKITRTPHVHLNDEADKYVIGAEVPGVSKENLDVSIGDNGRSVTIKGNTFSSSEEVTDEKAKEAEEPKVATESQASEEASGDKPTTAEGMDIDHPDVPPATVLTTAPDLPGTSTETTKTNKAPQTQPRWSTRSSFERKIWLPKPVDAQKVAARLENGILTLEVPKLQTQTHRITVA
ncbi:hypothetical protein FS837_012067 [Tulasnella sp. UAMH 9824]|nr:hypothetical protein FS837_012067 [Tulasnella sp. UAMH 9824]